MGFEKSHYFEELLKFFYEKTGIFFNEKRSIVAHRIDDFFKNHGIENEREYLPSIQRDSSLLQSLTNLLTVNETYFFREARAIEIFADLAAEKRDKFRTLCIPSSSGEEPYTLAISLKEKRVDSYKYELIGIDINSEVINAAKDATYGTRSLYRTPDHIKNHYFTKESDDLIKVSNEIKSCVRFEVCNLFDSCFRGLGEFDFVFCRNLLIYFDQASRIRAEKELFDRLKSGGYLFTGHADLIKNEVGFIKHFDKGTLYYQKP